MFLSWGSDLSIQKIFRIFCLLNCNFLPVCCSRSHSAFSPASFFSSLWAPCGPARHRGPLLCCSLLQISRKLWNSLLNQISAFCFSQYYGFTCCQLLTVILTGPQEREKIQVPLLSLPTMPSGPPGVPPRAALLPPDSPFE